MLVISLLMLIVEGARRHNQYDGHDDYRMDWVVYFGTYFLNMFIMLVLVFPMLTIGPKLMESVMKIRFHGSKYMGIAGWVGTASIPAILMPLALHFDSFDSAISFIIAMGILSLVFLLLGFWFFFGLGLLRAMLGMVFMLANFVLVAVIMIPVNLAIASMYGGQDKLLLATQGLVAKDSELVLFNSDSSTSSKPTPSANNQKPNKVQSTPEVRIELPPEPTRVAQPTFENLGPLPKMPPLGTGQLIDVDSMAPLPGFVEKVDVAYTRQVINIENDGPGGATRLLVCIPSGTHESESLPAVMLPWGKLTLTSGPTSPSETDTLINQFARRGIVTVGFTIDGSRGSSNQRFEQYKASQAGLANARITRAFIGASLDMVDPNQVYLFGEHIGGLAALHYAAADTPLAGVIVAHPLVDVRNQLNSEALRDIEQRFPGSVAWLDQVSPMNLVSYVDTPVLMIHSRDTPELLGANRYHCEQYMKRMKVRTKSLYVEPMHGTHDQLLHLHAVPLAGDWILKGGTPKSLNLLDIKLTDYNLSGSYFDLLEDLENVKPNKEQSQAIVKLLTRHINRFSGEDRITASQMMLNWGGAKAVAKPWEMLLSHQEPAVKAWGFAFLKKYQPKSAIEPLAHQLTNYRSSIETEEVLVAYGSKAETALLHALENARSSTSKANLVAVLGQIDTEKSKQAVKEIALSNDRSSNAARIALMKNEDLPKTDRIRMLVKSLDTYDAREQIALLTILAKTEPIASVQFDVNKAMQQLFERGLRNEAVESYALAYKVWGTPKLLLELLEPLNKEYGSSTRRRNAMMIMAIAKEPRGIQPISRWLIKDTENATDALIKYGKVAEPEIVKLINHRNETAAIAVANILAEIGDEKTAKYLDYRADRLNSAWVSAAAESAAQRIRDRLAEESQNKHEQDTVTE